MQVRIGDQVVKPRSVAEKCSSKVNYKTQLHTILNVINIYAVSIHAHVHVQVSAG